ncbi:MAG: hypothetical protein ABEH65_02740 [Halobacteriales archaeon]
MYRTFPIVVVLLLAQTAGLAAADSANVTVTVTVVDQRGDPIRNAELIATWTDGSTTAVTKSNGQALLDVPRGARVTLTVNHRIYTRNRPFVIESATEETVTVEIARKSEATITVTGDDGPIEGARVRFIHDGHIVHNGTTGVDGTIESGVVEAGIYRLEVFKSGYYHKSVSAEIRRETTREIAMKSGVVTLTFRIIDTNLDPPEPVADATIRGEELGSVRTQQNGVQQVSVPVNTELSVTIEKEGYRTVTRSIAIGESDRQINITTRKKRRISFEVLNDRVVVGERVRVAVTDQYDEPIAEATVLFDGEPAGTTNAEGVALLSIDTPGRHEISVKANDQTSDTRTVVGVRPATTTAGTTQTPIEDGGSDGGGTELAGVIVIPGTDGFAVHFRSLGGGIIVGIVLTTGFLVYRRLNSGGE